ncbi:acetoin utilization protein AcuC [Salinithrix halophila]|uniref:Acetoin utilization protein AcuC n=1 Tax=Salinithrix halophila TaxID=1485204 RepID=A0ABV8JJQ4_9BACL
MNDRSLLIHSDDFLTYRFSDTHPFNNRRLELTLDLIRSLDLLSDEELIAPRPANDNDLSLVHDPDFIETVKQADSGNLPIERLESYGLSTEDNPVFPGIHDASALVVGGTLTAAKAVMSGQADHALNLSGGLHHALRGKASGFCIYNDASVAIAWMRKAYDARVMYIDTDAHHGDGVQWSFYNDPNVLTLSIHETGRYLFPGTGHVYERGHDIGLGSSINVPLDAFTEDASFLDTLHRVVPEVARHFKPDVILSQNGCDAHHYDPLTHLSGTMRLYREIPKLVHELAHEWCDGRWIAVGGGGYDIWRVVPRAWTYLWAELSHRPLDKTSLPKAWLERWKKESPVDLPATLHDPDGLFDPIPRREEITQKNALIVNQVLQFFE